MDSVKLRHALIDLAEYNVVYVSTVSDAEAVKAAARELGYETEIVVHCLGNNEYICRVELAGKITH